MAYNYYNPEIAVIVAVKNQKLQLEKTIKNVLDQNHLNIELIVIDGGSIDGTCDLLEKYNEKIKFWLSEKDENLYEALNKGWNIANKDSVILCLGAGDLIINFPLKELRNINNIEKVIYGRVKIGQEIIFKPKICQLTKFANTLHHQALLIPKRICLKGPFDTKYKIYADFDLNQRLIKSGVQFKYSSEFLSYALPGGVSSIYSFEAVKIAFKNHGFIYCLLAFIFLMLQRFNIRKIYSRFYRRI